MFTCNIGSAIILFQAVQFGRYVERQTDIEKDRQLDGER